MNRERDGICQICYFCDAASIVAAGRVAADPMRVIRSVDYTVNQQRDAIRFHADRASDRSVAAGRLAAGVEQASTETTPCRRCYDRGVCHGGGDDRA